MTDYTPPLEDMQFVINELARYDLVKALPAYGDYGEDLVKAVLEEAGKLFSQVLAPLNRIGDHDGVRLNNGNVVMPPGFCEGYAKLMDGGWFALPFPVEAGGQGFPTVVAVALMEMMQSANLAFSMCPLLTAGAVLTLRAFAPEVINSAYVPNLVSGKWSATMALTEPQAGSDLSEIATKAVANGDHYLLTGQKIFISYGDHDMAENIVHLVLARMAGAPQGVKGISLFVVPKYVPDAEGRPGEANDVQPISIEHKLGLHASPTCTMSFGENGGAKGYLVGEANKGLAYMFTMMNHARLQVGLQGGALVERAYQDSVAYARERIQGLEKGSSDKVAIIEHPDVQRMLMSMKAGKEAIRAMIYATGAEMDLAEFATEEADRKARQARVDLLTPIIKGWSTEIAQELTQLAVQIHGGIGYIEETGVTQYLRDARITTIYEGTSAIQAMDLVRRKLLKDNGEAFIALLQDIGASVREADTANKDVRVLAQALEEAVCRLELAIEQVFRCQENNDKWLGAVAFDFMMLSGYVVGGWYMLQSAIVAQRKLESGLTEDRFYLSKAATARFFMNALLPRTAAHAQVVMGKSVVMPNTEWL